MAMASGKLPDFINHVDSGTIIAENSKDVWINLTNVAVPKVILVYSNDFDMMTNKADKTILGAVAS